MRLYHSTNYEGKGKVKGKVHPRTGHEGPEGEQMYRMYVYCACVCVQAGGCIVERSVREL